MKRSPLKRNTRLEAGEPMKRGARLRRTWMKRRRPQRLTPRDPEIIAAYEQLAALGADVKHKLRPNGDPAFVAWAHDQPCTFARYIPGHVCSGTRIVFCHEGPGSGVGLKCADRDGFAACEGGHRQFTDVSGEFKTWDKEKRREFEAAVLGAEYARYLSAGSRRAA